MTSQNHIVDVTEMVVCAAVLCVFEHWEMCDRFEQIIMCVHYDDGIVNDIKNAFINENTDFISSQNGFITNSGRFVDPIEAQQVAIKSGQYIDPNEKIKAIERAIDTNWFNVQHARSSRAIAIYKRYIAEDKAKIEELKKGYFGAEFRIEDLHYER